MADDAERVYTIPLGKVLLSPDNRRAMRAINMIREFARRHMKIQEIKIDQALSHEIWARGIRRPPRKVRVRMSKTEEGHVLVSPYSLGKGAEDAAPKPDDAAPADDAAPQTEGAGAEESAEEGPAPQAGKTEPKKDAPADPKPEKPAPKASPDPGPKKDAPADPKPEKPAPKASPDPGPKKDAPADTKPEKPAPKKDAPADPKPKKDAPKE